MIHVLALNDGAVLKAFQPVEVEVFLRHQGEPVFMSALQSMSLMVDAKHTSPQAKYSLRLRGLARVQTVCWHGK